MDVATRRHRWKTPEEYASEAVTLTIERATKAAHAEIREMAAKARERFAERRPVVASNPLQQLTMQQAMAMNALAMQQMQGMANAYPQNVYGLGGSPGSGLGGILGLWR